MAGPGPGRPGGPRRPGGRKGTSDRTGSTTLGRRLKQRVVTAKGRSVSSKRWLERQLNDPYVAAARERGLRSRAAFKLAEIDDKARFLKPGAVVVDLGAAPGGWSQIAAQRVRAGEGRGRVIALDLAAMDPLPGVTVLQRDFLESEAVDALLQALEGEKADAVISDMAAPASGHRQTDHLKIMALCDAALDFARRVLKPGGTFLCKVLRGGTERELLEGMKRDFAAVRHVKPKASRSDSAELYVLATGFRALGAASHRC
jgi:23S rRNA (uridine2552-2'-O)-methyltransferase